MSDAVAETLKSKASAAAQREVEYWAHKVQTDDCVVLGPMADNTYVWLADLTRVALNRGCQALLAAGPGDGDESTANDDQNLQLILKKIIHPDLWLFLRQLVGRRHLRKSVGPGTIY